ncbi:MAG: hypothetical protein FJ144_15950 [Deltaproteobacteria bacterium]|nr:hypothetical protein [Deltaproteobacteria bacterium]
MDGGVPSGTVLASEVALSAASGEVASVAQLSTVESSPGLALTISSAQTSTTPAGLVDVSIDYVNEGGTSVSNVAVSLDPGSFSTVLSTNPAVANLQAPTWNIGTVAPGAGGTLEVQVVASAPSGGILTLVSSATGTGQMRSATLHLPSLGSGDVTVTKAQYRVGKRNNVQMFLEIDDLPPGLSAGSTNSEDVFATVSTATQTLATIRFPPGTLSPKGTGWKTKIDSPGGGQFSIGIQPKKGIWRIRVKTKNLPALPFASSHHLRMSLSLGGGGFSATRTFIARGPETPTNQFLRYRGD